MKKFITLLLAVLLVIPFSGCVKRVKVDFYANDQLLGSVEGKAPLDISNEAPIIESTQYKFINWVDEAGNDVDITVPLEADTVLHAKLVKICKVSWMSEGDVLAEQSYEKGETLVLPEIDIPQSKQVHYVFDKWLLNNEALPAELTVEDNMSIVASYEYTMERIDIEINPLVFEKTGEENWKRAGIIDNMYGVEALTITSSDPSIAYYYDTHIFPVSSGECEFKIVSKSGLIRYLKVIVK